MVGASPLWIQQPEAPWRWDRRTTRSTEYSLRIDVTEAAGARPVLAARGFYY
jgi:hypothetical protein